MIELHSCYEDYSNLHVTLSFERTEIVSIYGCGVITYGLHLGRWLGGYSRTDHNWMSLTSAWMTNRQPLEKISADHFLKHSRLSLDYILLILF